jgi:tetratricopeptide (TPR) repeat protein
MICRRTAPQGVSSLLRLTVLALSALWLATPGCVNTQRQAREAAAERWNHMRAQVKAKLASDQLAGGHVEDAANELAEALHLDPTDPELRTLQARVCLARGDLPAAERLLEDAQAEGATRAETHYLLGIIQEQRLQWPAALEHFLRAAIEDPQDVAYVVAIAQAMLQLGEAEDALAWLEAYEQQFGWTSAYHAARAECCEQLEDWAEAASAWRKVADADGDPEIRERLATALYRAGRWSEAAQQFEQLLGEPETRPATPIRLALAECLLEEGQLAAAQKHLGLVLRDDPRNVTALQLVARLFAEWEQFERARQTAEQALRLAPDEPRTLELAAALAFRTGDDARALALAKRTMDVAPDMDNSVARQILSRLGTAQAASNE